MPTVFIDGQAGTTGLKIYDHLKDRRDIELLQIPADKRKDVSAKTQYLNDADLAILCLPDAAAKETVALIRNPRTKVLDASSAHRTAAGWVYGLPELEPAQAARIAEATRVSNPGCYPTGFILAVRPLVAAGLLPADYPITVNAISGHSGGGKELIAKHEAHAVAPANDDWSFRPYGLALQHKHVPEMQKYTGLAHPPVFAPAVVNFPQGMLVSVPLANRLLKGAPSAEQVHAVLSEYYAQASLVRVQAFQGVGAIEDGFLSPFGLTDTNYVDLFVFGHATQTLLIARLDNLGKGASLAALQNMGLMLGLAA